MNWAVIVGWPIIACWPAGTLCVPNTFEIALLAEIGPAPVKPLMIVLGADEVNQYTIRLAAAISISSHRRPRTKSIGDSDGAAYGRYTGARSTRPLASVSACRSSIMRLGMVLGSGS